MSIIPKELLFTKSHEWVRKSGTSKVVKVGITDFAQSALGDVTFVQLPEVGRTLKREEVFGSVESVKTASDLYAPVSGKVVAVNPSLGSDPAPVNQEPYGNGWLLEIEMSDESELAKLLQPQAYEAVAQ